MLCSARDSCPGNGLPAKVMVYLHKSLFQSHGYLSSAHCHVDSRWVLKISGFGLHAFTKDTSKEVHFCFRLRRLPHKNMATCSLHFTPCVTQFLHRLLEHSPQIAVTVLYRVAQKRSHKRVLIKSYTKLVSEARFLVEFECKRSIRILSVGTKYSMRDLIRDVISCCASSFDIGKRVVKRIKS